MDKDLKIQLKQIITGHRPRPLIGPFYEGSRKYYVRKRDLTYWQMRSKLPRKAVEIIPKKHFHVFRRHHHLAPGWFGRLCAFLEQAFSGRQYRNDH